jgi:CHASE2 domain-containing sensor protein
MDIAAFSFIAVTLSFMLLGVVNFIVFRRNRTMFTIALSATITSLIICYFVLFKFFN